MAIIKIEELKGLDNTEHVETESSAAQTSIRRDENTANSEVINSTHTSDQNQEKNLIPGREMNTLSQRELENPVVLVGIDFGTTFTGVAHAFITKNQSPAGKVMVVQDWPGSNKTSDKVPTRFAYIQQDEQNMENTPDSESVPTSQPVFKWGFELEASDPAIDYIKLFLTADRDLPKHIRRDDLDSELKKHGKTIEDAVSDYLHEINKVVEQSLLKKYAQSRLIGTERVNIITVPAIWSDAAKCATKRAAQKAGFANPILLVSEPEAAAIWTIQNTEYLDVEVGQKFVICDAGGGTVDLISYEITQVSPLRVKECAVGSGGFCGASVLNRRFEQRLGQNIGVTALNNFKNAYPERWNSAMKVFEENVKRNFNPQNHSTGPDRVFKIVCPGIPKEVEPSVRGPTMVKGDIIMLSTPELKEIFETPVTEVIELVQKQVESATRDGTSVAAIMLVGGFSESEYLFSRVRAHFERLGLDVLQPPDAWSAIAKGAVLWRAEEQRIVESRKARYHYGSSARPVFVKDLHPPESKVWDPLCEIFRSSNRFKCFIEKDKSIHSTEIFSQTYIKTLTGDIPPEDKLYMLFSSANSIPKDCDEPSVQHFCILKVDLSAVPETLFKDMVNSEGTAYKKLSYVVKMQLESGGLRIWFEAGNIEYGSVTAQFD